MRTLLLLAILLAATAMSGCTGSDAPLAADDPTPSTALPGRSVPDNATTREQTSLAMANATFGWVVGASAAPAQKAVQAEVADRLVMEVPNGTTSLVADATWRCTAALCDATAILFAGSDRQEFVVSWPADAAQASGVKTVQLTLTEVQPGPYTLAMVSTDVSVIILGEVRLTAYG